MQSWQQIKYQIITKICYLLRQLPQEQRDWAKKIQPAVATHQHIAARGLAASFSWL